MKLPLVDGQQFIDRKLQPQIVGGSILADRSIHTIQEKNKIYNHEICWTIRGDWFRRSDGLEMTGASGTPTTISEFYKLRKTQSP